MAIVVESAPTAAAWAGEFGLWAESGRQAYRLGRDIYNMAGYKRGRADYVRTHGRADNTGADVLHGSRLAVGQNVAYTRSYHRYGKGRSRRYGRLLESVIFKDISFYQGINDSSHGSRFFPLSIDYSAASTTYLPMYAFNLTGLAHNGQLLATDPTALTGAPMYRLRKEGKLAVGTQQYVWGRCDGNNIDASANSRWQREWSSSLNHPTVDTYEHCWSSVKLLFESGTAPMGMKMHVALVKFDNDAGPRRTLYNKALSAYEVYDGAADKHVADQNDEFWEAFWARKVVHPLARFKQDNKTRCIKFLKHVTINCETMNRNDAVGSGPRHLMNFFFKNHRSYNCKMPGATQVPTMASEGLMIAETVIGDHAAGTTPLNKPYQTNQLVPSSVSGLFDDAGKEVYMLIWCDMFGNEQSSGSNTCSFDILVRNKYMMSANPYSGISTNVTNNIPG